MAKPDLVVSGKGVTTMTYEVFKALDHSALCQALGLPFDRSVTPRRPKRSKR
jgi:hypothetical protein